MTEERQRPNFERYQYGALAGLLARSKESAPYAPSALELLAGERGLDLGEEAEGFIRGTQASREGIETAINVYAGKFQQARGEYKPIELVSWYDSVLSGLDENEKGKIIRHLGEYDETFASIVKKFSKANYVLSDDAPDGLFTDDQRSEARRTLEKYGKVMNTLRILDSYKFESLRPAAIVKSRDNDLKDLASKL